MREKKESEEQKIEDIEAKAMRKNGNKTQEIEKDFNKTDDIFLDGKEVWKLNTKSDKREESNKIRNKMKRKTGNARWNRKRTQKRLNCDSRICVKGSIQLIRKSEYHKHIQYTRIHSQSYLTLSIHRLHAHQESTHTHTHGNVQRNKYMKGKNT